MTVSVYPVPDMTKSSGRSRDTGVSNWMSGYASSSTSKAMDAAVMTLDDEAMSKRSDGEHAFRSDTQAYPKAREAEASPWTRAIERPGTWCSFMSWCARSRNRSEWKKSIVWCLG